MELIYETNNGKLIHGDNIEVMKEYEDDTFDSGISDFPYDLKFMGKCYHPDTEILTVNGWKNIKEIIIGELIYSLNNKTNEIEITNCNNTYEYDFNGELIEIKGRSIHQIITPNHNILISYDKNEYNLIEAQAINKNFYMINQGIWNGLKVENININNKIFNIKHFMKLLGIFLGDGCVVNRKNQPKKQNFISLTGKKERKLNAITNCLDNLNIKYKQYINNNGVSQFFIYDKSLLQYFSNLGKASEKYIPKELFKYNKEILQYLFQGLIETDGCFQGKNQITYYTVSEQLANDFQQLCLLIGKSATKTKKINSENAFKSDIGYCFTLSVLHENKHFSLSYYNYENNKTNIIKYKYIGKVNCIELKDNHIMLTRLNGKTVWSGNSWDNTGNFYEWCKLRAVELYRIIKPGGYACIFGHHKTNHRMKCAFEDSGFKIVEEIDWIYGSGFPKNQDIGKLFDKKAGVEREIIGERTPSGMLRNGRTDEEMSVKWSDQNRKPNYIISPSSDLAKQWDGFKTSGLKPAHEPITIFQKPLEGTYIQNIEKYNCGAMNIDACRIPTSQEDKDIINAKASKNPTTNYSDSKDKIYGAYVEDKSMPANEIGRFPANIILDSSMGEILDSQSGITKSGKVRENKDAYEGKSNTGFLRGITTMQNQHGDMGGASRYFLKIEDEEFIPFLYCAKPSKKEKGEGNTHVTVKPKQLIKWLIKLVTPIDGKTIDCCAGSGTHGLSCEELNKEEGYNLEWVNIELMNTEKEPYCEIAMNRIKSVI